MTQQLCQSRQAERGFTLVELAIVMIIIGLLIGGILKGQELISNARVTSTAAQVKAIDAAVTTFRDQYAALPGDIASPGTRLPNCQGVAPCDTITGLNTNGRIETVLNATFGSAVTAANEVGSAFIHLAVAGLIGGVNQSATAWSAADALPAAEAGGRWTLGYVASAVTAPTGTAAVPAGHYVLNSLNGAAPTTAAGAGAIAPKIASAIDRKLDDGMPNAGSVRAGGSTNCSQNADTSPYVTSNTTAECFLYARVQQ